MQKSNLNELWTGLMSEYLQKLELYIIAFNLNKSIFDYNCEI